MESKSTQAHQDIRYEPDERPPLALSVGLGWQYAMLAVAGIVLTPTLMIRIAGGSEAYLSWAVFAALVISGTTTVVQAARRGWNEEMTDRLRAVGEETLLTLIQQKEEGQAHDGRRLLLIAHSDGDAADLEFIAATDETNLEDQVALLSERAAGGPVEEEISLRLLRHYASSVRHQQYHDTDVVTVRVEPAISA